PPTWSSSWRPPAGRARRSTRAWTGCSATRSATARGSGAGAPTTCTAPAPPSPRSSARAWRRRRYPCSAPSSGCTGTRTPMVAGARTCARTATRRGTAGVRRRRRRRRGRCSPSTPPVTRARRCRGASSSSSPRSAPTATGTSRGSPGRASRGTSTSTTTSTGWCSRSWRWAASRGAAMAERRVLLAAPRSFCAGVERAIDVVERALARFGAPVYVRRQIVHNTYVVRDLESKGAIFVEELDEVPDGAVAVLAAHGVAPTVREEAHERRLVTIDATCPLVAKVHHEARRYADLGYSIVLVGHPDHEEVVGTHGEAPDAIHIVED